MKKKIILLVMILTIAVTTFNLQKISASANNLSVTPHGTMSTVSDKFK